VTGVVCRAVRHLSAAATARAGLKLTTAGMELDVGATRRMSDVATGGCSVNVGLQVGGEQEGMLMCFQPQGPGHMGKKACPAQST
jgi:hypothetical protein